MQTRMSCGPFSASGRVGGKESQVQYGEQAEEQRETKRCSKLCFLLSNPLDLRSSHLSSSRRRLIEPDVGSVSLVSASATCNLSHDMTSMRT